jgi:DNA helicase-2/ATP-dependent DNA helicase PcrA
VSPPDDASKAGFNLSPEQSAVVDHRGSDLQVIACAGSGKTESVSRRIAALIGEGVEPASIIAFTFTERAAAELKDRVVRRVGERMGEAFLDRLGPMFVGTIHGYWRPDPGTRPGQTVPVVHFHLPAYTPELNEC